MDYKTQEAVNKAVTAIREGVDVKLENKLYDFQISGLGVYDIAEQAITDYINKILTDEKVLNKLVNQTSKAIMEKHNKKETAKKAENTRDRKLWKVTKGKIPCLNECGYHKERTEKEVMEGFNSFVCADCTKELEKDSRSMFDVFESKNVYKIYNIE